MWRSSGSTSCPLAETKVLVVLVMRGGHVSNKVVDIGERLQMSDLHQAANYLNEQFAGMPLGEVRAAVVVRMAEERTLYDSLLSRALRLARVLVRGPQRAAGAVHRGRRIAAGGHPKTAAASRSARCGRCCG